MFHIGEIGIEIDIFLLLVYSDPWLISATVDASEGTCKQSYSCKGGGKTIPPKGQVCLPPTLPDPDGPDPGAVKSPKLGPRAAGGAGSLLCSALKSRSECTHKGGSCPILMSDFAQFRELGQGTPKGGDCPHPCECLLSMISEQSSVSNWQWRWQCTREGGGYVFLLSHPPFQQTDWESFQRDQGLPPKSGTECLNVLRPNCGDQAPSLSRTME